MKPREAFKVISDYFDSTYDSNDDLLSYSYSPELNTLEHFFKERDERISELESALKEYDECEKAMRSWHQGAPAENGKYLCKTDLGYEVLKWCHGHWDYGAEVKEWLYIPGEEYGG